MTWETLAAIPHVGVVHIPLARPQPELSEVVARFSFQLGQVALPNVAWDFAVIYYMSGRFSCINTRVSIHVLIYDFDT